MKNMGQIRNMIHQLEKLKEVEVEKNTDSNKRTNWTVYDRAESAQQALEWVVNDKRTKSPVEFNR